MNQALFDPGHPDIAITQTGMAILLLRTERAAAALDLAQAAHASLAEAYGGGSLAHSMGRRDAGCITDGPVPL